MENNFQFLVYRSAEEDVSVDAFIKEDTVWLTQRGMAKLFDCSVDNISLHLKNIYAEGELIETETTEESSVVQTEGNRRVRRPAKLYNLDAIISVGYRVNSRRATHFRIWATGVLKEYMTKGFVLDDERQSCGRHSQQPQYIVVVFWLDVVYNRGVALQLPCEAFCFQMLNRPLVVGPPSIRGRPNPGVLFFQRM